MANPPLLLARLSQRFISKKFYFKYVDIIDSLLEVKQNNSL